MSQELTSLTADVVSAFVSHNSTRPEDMVDLLKQVHGKLAEVMKGKPTPDAEDKPVPAVPVKKSITNDAIYCLVCGQAHKMLKRHLRSSHDLDPAAYREMFALRFDYPLTAPSYSETRSGLATKLGLGRKPKQVAPEPAVAPTEPTKAEKVQVGRQARRVAQQDRADPPHEQGAEGIEERGQRFGGGLRPPVRKRHGVAA